MIRRTALVFLFFALPLLAKDPPPAPKEYLDLQRWQYQATPQTVPAGGLKWEMEGASWSLDSGKIWVAESGTGIVFEGKGRFRMAVPDPIELAQLRRFTQKPELQEIDEPFTALVLRTAGELPIQLAAPSGGFKEHKLARERHEHWLTQRLFDADSRVLAALKTPGDRFLRVDAKTQGFGWLTFDYDAQRLEEIRLETFNSAYSYPEVWLSLDRAADRDPQGRPAGHSPSRHQPAIDVEHADITADLTEAGRDEDFFKGRFQVGIRFNGSQAGAQAVQLYLHPFAKLTSVTEDGQPAPFIRDHIGGRRGIIDNRVYDDSLVVLLNHPIVPGESRRLDFEYEIDLTNYVHSRVWYPEGEGDETFLTDPHTARLDLTARKKHEIRAMGRREETPEPPGEDRGRSHGVWVIDHPVKMVTFSFAEKFHEEKIKLDGVPEVICFGSKVEVSRRARFADVGQDVAASLAYFQKLLDSPLPPDPIYVTSIAARHGQAFDGFIHLGEQTFDLLGPGIAELFRAHETAHQWWGHRLGAATYRDAWLGEAFAEYTAMMFVADTVPDGPKLFQEILRSYQDEMNGSIKSGFSKFARTDINLANRTWGNRIGPVGHGWRANTGEVPTAYSSLVYGKGALVLHMLRGLLREATGSDQALVDVLRDFLRTHQGGVASTSDLAAAVARRAPGDWSWFFEEWVERAEIPTYRWSYGIQGNTATLHVRQTDVPAGFRMSVPVRIEMADGTSVERFVKVDEPEESFELSFESRPKALVFNPDYAVLAKMKRD
ncbi:MAG TPA: M1 family aminopeptidase [Thermoanaerobaculia bacterium]|nr:M1 family aminopeptidase [Thermoanaerobaculia bacterium]